MNSQMLCSIHYSRPLVGMHAKEIEIWLLQMREFKPQNRLLSLFKYRFQRNEIVTASGRTTILQSFHYAMGQRHVNHPPIDHPYKCHENTNHSRVPQLSKVPIPTSKWKYVPNLLQT